MKRVITLIIFSYCLALQAQESSLLWEVSGKGLKRSSYLYGTMHSKDSRAHQFGDSVLVKLAQADIVMVESITDNKDPKELLELTMMKDVELKDLLSEEDFEFAKKEVLLKMGLMGMFFNNMKPFITGVMLGEVGSINEMSLTVDNYLVQRGRELNKKIVTLESTEEAMAAIDAISLKEQAEMLLETLKDFDKNVTMKEEFMVMYFNQDINAMYDFYSSFEELPASFDKELINDRNKKFIDGFLSHFKKNSVFCAVGALHLPGKTGLINALRDKGYIVKPVISSYHHQNLTLGREKEWVYNADDSSGIVMGFPESPYYENTSLTSVDGSKIINFINYYISDTVNQIKYSVKAGRMFNSIWTKDEVIGSLIVEEGYQKLNEKEESYYEENTTWVEFYVADGMNNRTAIVIKNNIVYLIEMFGSKASIYSDLSHYFFGGVYLGTTAAFQAILDNEENFTIDIEGSLFDDNGDSIIDYEIYVVEGLDTVTFQMENESKFEISLSLGGKYVFGLKKEGYQQKHVIIDVIESGTPLDSKYGFVFPMHVTLLKGDVKSPSVHVATIKYDPFTGYMGH